MEIMQLSKEKKEATIRLSADELVKLTNVVTKSNKHIRRCFL